MNRDAHRWHVELLAAALEDSSRRELCPACAGGRSNEKSLRVSRDGSRYYATCFRASCGFRLSGSLAGDASDVRPRRPKRCYDIRELELRHLRPEDAEYFKARFGVRRSLSKKHLRVAGLRGAAYYAALAAGFDGKNRAVYVRLRPWSGNPPCPYGRKAADGPKTKTYLLREVPPWGVVQPGGADLWLVEDFVSALRVASAHPEHSAVFLGGTHLHEDLAAQLMARKFHSVTIALDPDANKPAMALLRKWQGAIPALSVKFLTQDPKDCPMRELRVENGR